jgi:hypothetical protein
MGWERELQLLERAIQRVNAEYDGFFYGTAAKPPVQSRRTVDEMIRRLSSAEAESAADRYRLATLQGRYVALCERWERLQTEKEAGRRPGVRGGFARDSTHLAAASPGPGPNRKATSSVLTGKASPAEQDLFDRYVAARKARGEDVAGYDLGRFIEGLNRERAKLKERFGDVAVEFDVADRDGRVRLVARKKS